MTHEQSAIPKWILIVSVLFALMELMVSIAICVSPESVLEQVDFTAKGVMYLAYMWGARQFALAFIFAFATIKRSASMLTIAYVFFLVMFIGDLCIGISQKENALIISALVMCAISAAMIYFINKKK